MSTFPPRRQAQIIPIAIPMIIDSTVAVRTKIRELTRRGKSRAETGCSDV